MTPNSVWRLETDRETWLLALSGAAHSPTFDVAAGEAAFIESDSFDIRVGPAGFTALAAYTGEGVITNLLKRFGRDGEVARDRPMAGMPAANFQRTDLLQ